MSDLIRQLAQQRSQRYQQLPESEKPRATTCPQCGEATYHNEVCPETGLFHDLEQKTVVGGNVVKSKFITSSELMSAIERTRIKWMPSRTQLVKADAQSLNIFQSFVAQLDWSLQRYGILYGRYDEALATIEVHAVYEPEQRGNTHSFTLLEDTRMKKIDLIARGLGLRRVGAICTHSPRDPDVIVLSAREMLLCAREQSRFGDECVLLSIAPNLKDGGVVECQAWQTSPQCVHLFRLGMLHEPAAGGGDYLCSPEAARMVESTVALEVAQEDTDASGHRRFVTKAPSHLIDTRWFTSYIAVQQFGSDVVRSLFMRISRPGRPSPTFQNLRNYMNDPKRKGDCFADKIADFHVLVFLAETFSTEDDLPILVAVAKGKTMTEEARNYEALLLEYLK